MPWLFGIFKTFVSVSDGQTEFLCCYLARYCAWNVVILTKYQGGLVARDWSLNDVFFWSFLRMTLHPPDWMVQQPFLQHSRVYGVPSWMDPGVIMHSSWWLQWIFNFHPWQIFICIIYIYLYKKRIYIYTNISVYVSTYFRCVHTPHD